MCDFYLVTGFLGAGKTTFLKRFVRWLAPQKTRVIINEFGRVAVDAALLADLNASVAEVAGGSVFCSCRLDQFERALTAALKDAPDVVVVEASGLSDPSGIWVLLGQPGFGGFVYKGCICLADAARLEKAYATARPCKKQLSVSDVVLLNKCDEAGGEQIESAERLLRQNHPGAAVYRTQHGAFEPQWITAMRPAQQAEAEAAQPRDISLQKAAVQISGEMTPAQLEHFIRQIAEDTYRVKGFAVLGGVAYFADCVGTLVQVTPWAGALPQSAGTLVALAGPGMPLRKSVKTAALLYPGLVAVLPAE